MQNEEGCGSEKRETLDSNDARASASTESFPRDSENFVYTRGVRFNTVLVGQKSSSNMHVL